MKTHEEITEVIDEMDLNRPFTLSITELSRQCYMVRLECDTHHLTHKVFQSEFNTMSADVSDFICTCEYTEFTLKTFEL